MYVSFYIGWLDGGIAKYAARTKSREITRTGERNRWISFDRFRPSADAKTLGFQAPRASHVRA